MITFKLHRSCFTLMAFGLGLLLWIPQSWADLQEGISAYHFGQYTKALRELRPLAEDGVANAQFYLGLMYAKGRGVPQDYAEALRWYRLAAEQSFPMAMANLGVMYSKGRGVPQNYTEAVRWYQEAAEQGLAEAQYNLGVMYKEGHGVLKDYVQAHMWFNLAAGDGNEEAYRARGILAKLMTGEEIVAAQKLARAWQPKPKDPCQSTSLPPPSPCP